MIPKPTPIELSSRRSFAVVPILVTFAAIGNTLVTMMLWNSNTELISSFACGMLIAQPALLSIWCALVKQNLLLRVSLSMGIMFALYCAYMVTLGSLDEMSLEVPLVCLGLVAGLALLIQTPLFVIRKTTGYALATSSNENTSKDDSQFGIKHLMIATAVAAVVIAIAQTAFSQLESDGGAPPWREIFAFLMTLAVFTTVIVWLCIGVVFLNRIRIVAGILLALVAVIGPLVVFGVFSRVLRGGAVEEIYFNTLAFAVSLIGTILAVLIIFYAIGYRLIRETGYMDK